jgi:hypothetical protein
MPVEDRLDRRLGRAGLVGILDPQQELAAVVAGEQPVEQRGARAADMQVARSARGEAGDARSRRSELPPRLRVSVPVDKAPDALGRVPRSGSAPG